MHLAYSFVMRAQLKSLERKLDELIRLTRNLKGENFTLRQKLVLVENEKQQLEKIINRATSKVEGLMRLKTTKSP
jgi:low affinity Fe/Cu permease